MLKALDRCRFFLDKEPVLGSYSCSSFLDTVPVLGSYICMVVCFLMKCVYWAVTAVVQILVLTAVVFFCIQCQYLSPTAV
jgi:hypothetical protein